MRHIIPILTIYLVLEKLTKANTLDVMILKKVSLFIFCCFVLIGCKDSEIKNTPITESKIQMTKKFMWKPTECAPKHYPVSIYQGDFISEDNDYFTIPKGGTVSNGWGSSGSVWSKGSELKPVPARLKIIWISYTENQFYFGDFELPKQKMIDLFEEGFINTRTNKQETYNNIAVGLAPGGAVSVWLLGGGHTVEIGHYKAKKTDVSMADFKPNAIISLEEYITSRKKEFSEETNQVIATQGIPIGKWSDYTKRFLWKPKVTHQEAFKLDVFSNNLYNGESYNALENNPIFNNFKNYPPPKEIFLRWYNKLNYKFGCTVYFNEAEIWEAFENLYKKPTTKQVELLLHIDKYNSNLKIKLATEKDTIDIKKATVKFYDTSD